MEYKENKFGYKFLRPIIGFLFKIYFHPKVKGVENIPKKGSFVLCGNHRNVHDQFPIMINTKRVIHYMAKKEYFDSKMGWFFKFVGQIPVNREIKDVNAKDEAIHILESGGVLGIFPEGTRNILLYKDEKKEEIYLLLKDQLSKKEFEKTLYKEQIKLSQVEYLQELKNKKVITKEDYIKNILTVDKYLQLLLKNKIITKQDYINSTFLPLKYGAVSLASKTNSPIVPFAVRGHYKFRSKDLEIIIGKPITIDKDLNVANQQLQEAIYKLLISE